MISHLFFMLFWCAAIPAAAMIASPYVAFAVTGDEMPEKLEEWVGVMLWVGMALAWIALLFITTSGIALIVEKVAA